MNNTALGAKNTKKQEIVFISEAHEKFYYEKLKEVRYQDVGVSQSLCKPPNTHCRFLSVGCVSYGIL